jgi:hypothetical protein
MINSAETYMLDARTVYKMVSVEQLVETLEVLRSNGNY